MLTYGNYEIKTVTRNKSGLKRGRGIWRKFPEYRKGRGFGIAREILVVNSLHHILPIRKEGRLCESKSDNGQRYSFRGLGAWQE